MKSKNGTLTEHFQNIIENNSLIAEYWIKL